MAAADHVMFAVVEIMGRRTRAGSISDAQLGGATLLRIEHPTATDHTGAEPLTEYYAPSAIFAIRPCSRDEAERIARWAWSSVTPAPALDAVFDDSIEIDDDPDDDGDEEGYEPPSFSRTDETVYDRGPAAHGGPPAWWVTIDSESTYRGYIDGELVDTAGTYCQVVDNCRTLWRLRAADAETERV